MHVKKELKKKKGNRIKLIHASLQQILTCMIQRRFASKTYSVDLN